MKFLRFALAFSFLSLFLACYEVNEDIVVNEDGSGVYEARMDLSQLLELMQSFAGEEEIAKNGLDRVMDTVVSMQSILDSADETTARENAWMKDGKMKVNMNVKEKLFKITVNIPYQSQQNLQSLMEGQGTLMNNSFSGLLKSNKKTTEKKDSSDDTVLQDLVAVYKVSIENGRISKQMDTAKFNALMDKPQAADLKQIAQSGIEMPYTTSFKLPRPVKNVSNELLKVSEDKRTVTLRYNMLDIVNDPSKYSFTIEY